MPIATPEVYAQMLDAAKDKSFAYPAINVSSSQTLNAALKGFADAGSDGIIQISTGGAEYLSGPSVKNMVDRLRRVRRVRRRGGQELPGQRRAAHRPLPEGQARRLRAPAASTSPPSGWPAARRRCSSRTCGTARRCRWRRTSRSPQELLEKCAAAHIILEVEIGVVGGEEDGVVGAIDDKLYSTPEDALATVRALGTGEKGRYMTALTFGNVHGVYKPGNVKLRPEILKAAQEAVVAELGLESGAKPFDLVFHGGSGSTAEEIGAAVDYGVVKMNVDTDTQYAFTRPVAAHMFANYDGVLKVDGEVGNKKAYDPRAWGKAGERRHGRAHRRGLREPPLRRYVARGLIVSAGGARATFSSRGTWPGHRPPARPIRPPGQSSVRS